MRKIFSSMDIGSDSIKIIVCELFGEKLNVLASVNSPSFGIKQGMVVDDDMAKEAIKKALDEINTSLGIVIDKTIINVPIYESEYMVNEGTTTITNENRVVTGNDMVNALQTSIYNKIVKSRELVTIQPIKYNVDSINQDILLPRGIRANKLSVTSMSSTVPKKNIYKIISVLQDLKIEVIDILFGIIGDYYTFKTKDIEKSICGVINIGSDKIELATFKKGIIYNSNIVQAGSGYIDKDISYIYNISNKHAKKIKEMFALAHKDFASTSDVYEITNRAGIKTKINQYEVSEIVMSKIKEMLEISKKSLNDLTKKEISYIIVSGGIVNMPGFDVLCKEILGDKVIVNSIKTIGVRDNSYSQALGMIKYFIDKLSIRGKDYTMFDEDKWLELIENRKNNVNGNNNSVFGKLFNYLFDNKED
ncbi:MAG: hypothetical protein J6B64_02720 [Bacilli bacterium]|nr:hypothetical protein [Bacilli bacterium]MBP3635309.1 hypothetical protein [Bacilli bacterium]